MESLISNPVFQAYVGSVLVLGFLLLLLANNTALTRAKAKEVVNPEDRREATPNVVFYDGNDRTQRYRRAHGNALENVPLFMITGFLLTLTSVPFGLAAALFGIFVFFRLFHAVAYLNSLQPWRTASFVLAALDQLAILGVLGYYVFAG